MDLVDAIRGTSVYSPELITLEVGSRGPIHSTGFDHLQKYLGAPIQLAGARAASGSPASPCVQPDQIIGVCSRAGRQGTVHCPSHTCISHSTTAIQQEHKSSLYNYSLHSINMCPSYQGNTCIKHTRWGQCNALYTDDLVQCFLWLPVLFLLV